MKLYAYLRVSTEEQAAHGQSMSAQKDRVSSWARAMQHEVVAFYEDPGVSGSVAPSERPAFGRMLADLGAGNADGMIAVALSRFSRSTRDVLALVDRAEGEGWKIISVAESLDTSTAIGRFLVTVFAGLAQLERETTGERVSQTLQSMKREGKRVGRYAPWGWRLAQEDDRVMVPVAAEAVFGMEIGLLDTTPAAQIAAGFNETGRPHPRSGEPWTASDVNSVRRAIQRAAE